MQLIIVESPTKANTLSKFLGDKYEVEATKGHIKDLPKSTLGIDVDHNFKPEYDLVEKKADVIATLKKISTKAETIYLATDPDREGEAISQHVKEILDGKKGKIVRIVFHEITKDAVSEALANPRDVDTHLVDAQIARRVLDRLVGYKLSPLLWRKIRRGLSAGRVQTVAVRLIVEREKEIEKFKPVEYWEISADVKRLKGSEQFNIGLSKINENKAEVGDKGDADKIVKDLNGSTYKVVFVGKTEVKKNPYAPYTTSTMSQAGARLFGWSAKKTMSIAQALYEEGLITYHRTDSTNVSSSAVEKLRSFIKKEYGQEYLVTEPRIYKTTSKVAQEAHEAIRPTDLGNKYVLQNTKYSKEGKTLYNLIRTRFIQTQMSQSVYDETTIDVAATPKNSKDVYTLRASGQTMKFDGWKKLSSVNGNPEEQKLPEVVEGEVLNLLGVNSLQKFTEPPMRFNEASLIKMLEKLGIGRPSTYAPIISTIQIRNYVEKDEGKFEPTSVGIAVNDFLMEHFPDIFDYAFTAKMEDDLDSIANGNIKWETPISDFWKPFIKKLDMVTKKSKRVKIEVEKTGRKCPECKKGELVIRIGRFGKFISCSLFPECKYTEKYIEKIDMKCPGCKTGTVVVNKTRRGRKFFGCSRYPECKWASWRKPEKPSDAQSNS